MNNRYYLSTFLYENFFEKELEKKNLILFKERTICKF